MTTGECIKTCRINAGITQAELAKKLDISAVAVSQWERNIRTPKMGTLKKIASALGVDIYTLIPPKVIYSDPGDKLIAEAASSLPPLEPLTDEETAIKALFNSFGYDLIKFHGDYGLSHPDGIFTISKTDVDEIIAIAVGATKVAARSLLIRSYQALNQKTGCHIEPPPEEE